MTMTRIISLLKSRASLLVLLAIHSCDTFKGDEIEPEKQVTFSQTEYYVPARFVCGELTSNL